jgi:hypothetical protein
MSGEKLSEKESTQSSTRLLAAPAPERARRGRPAWNGRPANLGMDRRVSMPPAKSTNFSIARMDSAALMTRVNGAAIRAQRGSQPST